MELPKVIEPSKNGTIEKYIIRCPNCEALIQFEKFHVHFYEDCYDTDCAEFYCPECHTRQSVYSSKVKRVITPIHKPSKIQRDKQNETNKETLAQKLKRWLMIKK